MEETAGAVEEASEDVLAEVVVVEVEEEEEVVEGAKAFFLATLGRLVCGIARTR